MDLQGGGVTEGKGLQKSPDYTAGGSAGTTSTLVCINQQKGNRITGLLQVAGCTAEGPRFNEYILLHKSADCREETGDCILAD